MGHYLIDFRVSSHVIVQIDSNHPRTAWEWDTQHRFYHPWENVEKIGTINQTETQIQTAFHWENSEEIIFVLTGTVLTPLVIIMYIHIGMHNISAPYQLSGDIREFLWLIFLSAQYYIFNCAAHLIQINFK